MLCPKLTRSKRKALLPLAVLATFSFGLTQSPVIALDRLDFSVESQDEDLTKIIRGASLLLAQKASDQTSAEDMFTAARADYANILAALYAEGHFSTVIHITIDGQEAANILPLDAPKEIRNIRVSVDPGPKFTFGETNIGPLARNTELPEGFKPGEPARTGVVEQAVEASILAWREASHAKARVTRDDVLANHRDRKLSANIALEPGPSLRFGKVTVKGEKRMDPHRIVKIAGLREGEVFSQSELNRAVNRLRRTGIFSTVTLSESDRLENGGLMPIEIQVVENKPRRYSIGAEIASIDGVSLTGSWLHRNLLGGGERFKVEGAVTNIGSSESGMDYDLKVTIDRPATLTPDTTAGLSFELGHMDEVDYAANVASFGLNFTQFYSDQLTLRAGLQYSYVEGSDPQGDFEYKNLSLPLGLTWDRRDSTTDARDGFYVDLGLKPFLGFDTTDSGAKFNFDARGYQSFGKDDKLTVAARLQGGTIYGATLLGTPRDELFYSGGGGTVRGQPYRSLGVEISDRMGGTYTIGAASMIAASVELRGRITKSIGLVGFVDAGKVADEELWGGLSDFHAGAGIGLRYETGFGPIRLDVAAPVGGDTGDGVQLYIGLGQSF